MSDLIEVDLSEPEQPPRREIDLDSRWVWFAIGLGLGLLVTVVLNFSGDSPGSEGLGPGSGTTTTTSPATTLVGVGDEIPGFPDGLSALVSPGDGRALEILTWPHSGEPVYRSIPLGDFALASPPRFDSSGSFLAAVTSTAEGGLLLHAGRPNSFGVVADDVVTFAWHDSDAADLAWTKQVGDEVEVWVSDDRNQPFRVTSGIGIGTELKAWGDWGFALGVATVADDQSTSITTTILSPVGELMAQVEGSVVASHQTGLLLVQGADGMVRLELVTDGPVFAVRDLALPDFVTGGEFDPSGEQVAVVGFSGLSIVDLSSGEVTNHAVRPGSNSVTWSSDGRFVLANGFRGVIVVDTETSSFSTILQQEATRAVGSIPIGS